MAMSVTYATVHGRLVEENRGGVVTEYVPDTLGNVIMTTDESGTVTSTTTYWPFGEVRSQTGTNPSPWGFCGVWGYLTDAVSRMYVRARHYRADTSRWLTVDLLWPHELPYAYASNIPSTSIDYFGLAVACNQVIGQEKDDCSRHSDGLGACIAGACSVKSAKDIVDAIKKAIAIADAFGTLPNIDNLKKALDFLKGQTQMPTPQKCCKNANFSARNGGAVIQPGAESSIYQLIAYLCRFMIGTGSSIGNALCAQQTEGQDSCIECCRRRYPGYDDKEAHPYSLCEKICILHHRDSPRRSIT